MGIFDEEKGKMEAEPKEIMPYIKAKEFNRGLALKVKAVSKVMANVPDYGANEVDYLYKQDILEKGQTYRYVFETLDEFPVERTLESKSATFYIPFVDLNPDVGDKLWITRSGEGKNTRYAIDFYRERDKNNG